MATPRGPGDGFVPAYAQDVEEKKAIRKRVVGEPEGVRWRGRWRRRMTLSGVDLRKLIRGMEI